MLLMVMEMRMSDWTDFVGVISVCFNVQVLTVDLIQHILTSTKNASLIITDFLAMIKENEQRRTASLCRGWAMLENDFNLICR